MGLSTFWAQNSEKVLNLSSLNVLNWFTYFRTKCLKNWQEKLLKELYQVFLKVCAKLF